MAFSFFVFVFFLCFVRSLPLLYRSRSDILVLLFLLPFFLPQHLQNAEALPPPFSLLTFTFCTVLSSIFIPYVPVRVLVQVLSVQVQSLVYEYSCSYR